MTMPSLWWTCSKRKRGQHRAGSWPIANGGCGCTTRPPETEYETRKETTPRSSGLERDDGEEIPEPFRGRRAIHRNQAGTEPPTAAAPRAASSDANQGGFSPQNEPKPVGADGSGRPVRVSGPAGARPICFGSILEGPRQGLA